MGLESLIAGIGPFDEMERSHQADALDWLARTTDIYRRAKRSSP